jgi:hypothetical protein
MAPPAWPALPATKKAEVELRLCLHGYLSWPEHSLANKKRQAANSEVQKPAEMRQKILVFALNSITVNVK